MLDDVVIDTNVLQHACDPRQGHRSACLRLIDLMRVRNTLLCVDAASNPQRPLEGFIMTEYQENLAPGTPGRELLVFLLANSRVIPRSRQVPRVVAKQLEQLVHNKKDQKFVAVSYNSAEHVLASHDFRHFSSRVRRRVLNRISVEILDAVECSDRL